MKKTYSRELSKTYDDQVLSSTPMFIYKDGKLVGMVILTGGVWGGALGGSIMTAGPYLLRENCLTDLRNRGYEIRVED